ncbi:MAG: tRNA lysidine(34) synthetase TilS, partial [Steroidobacteraceae bacterium]
MPAVGSLQCVVAWSGGLDSTVLLHLLWRAARLPGARLTLRAVHVDHGLQPAAVGFRRFCQRAARRWRIPLQVVRSEVRPQPGDSIEESARRGRQLALAGALRPGELLVTAQHADDQLETLLLALLRGAGPAGLAGMPGRMPFAGSWLLRPLLCAQREAVAAYAREQALEWSEDPTNSQPRFDRNYLRAAVLPVLKSRWPAAARTALRSARHSAAAAAAVAEAAARDLDAAADGADIEVAVLRRFSAPRRAALLRLWLARAGLRAPNERHLAQIETMMAARVDAHPLLQLPDGDIRRAHGRLCVLRKRG